MRTMNVLPLTMSARAYTRRLLVAAAATVLALCAGRALHAQQVSQNESLSYNQTPPQGDQADPPSRVGRLSVLQGDVSFQPAGVADFSAAELNYPLTSGDRVYTGDNARAELEAGQLAVRLTAQSDFTVTTLSDDYAQFGLAQGSVHLRSFTFDPNSSTELDTPNASVTLLQAGDVRVSVFPQENITAITVFSGQVEINADGVQQNLQAGQSILLRGTNPVNAQLQRRPRPDALDQFSAQRDALYQQQFSTNAQYVNPDTIGASDLGQYGDWDNSQADYGAVWYPRNVAVDWAPYRTGHWAYVQPWGWTWVEAEPWGFAPFHYGRWNRFGNRWGWIPGPVIVHPVYSPALVVFVGGPGFSIGVNFGGGGVAAWFPLGPREVYRPWYHASPVYVNRINVTNIYNRNTVEVRNIYNNRNDAYGRRDRDAFVNRGVAITAVPRQSFERGRPVRDDAIRVDPRQFDRAPIAAGPGGQGPGFGRGGPDRHNIERPPARVMPPVTARPILSTRGPDVDPNRGNRGGDRNGGGRAPGQPAPSQPSPVPAQPAPGQPTQPGRGGYGGDRGGRNPSQPPVASPAPPQPSQPAPTQPAPTQPGRGGYGGDRGGRNPAQPPVASPTPPQQVQPAPTQPAPAQPAPTQPGRGGSGDRGGSGRNPAPPPAVTPSPAPPATTQPMPPQGGGGRTDEPVLRGGPRQRPGAPIRTDDGNPGRGGGASPHNGGELQQQPDQQRQQQMEQQRQVEQQRQADQQRQAEQARQQQQQRQQQIDQQRQAEQVRQQQADQVRQQQADQARQQQQQQQQRQAEQQRQADQQRQQQAEQARQQQQQQRQVEQQQRQAEQQQRQAEQQQRQAEQQRQRPTPPTPPATPPAAEAKPHHQDAPRVRPEPTEPK